MITLDALMNSLPQRGAVRWIGLRPARRATVEAVDSVAATVEKGLVGDRYSGRPGGKRQVTLIQHEHLAAVAACVGASEVSPAVLRRNIVVSGINLLALKGKRFTVGPVTLEYTTVCAPCSFMEDTLGPGGYNAVRGHGGICARVLEPGEIRLGDAVAAIVNHA